MSKERELLERAYYVLGELSYAMLKVSGEYNLAGDIYEHLSTPEPEQDEEPVACSSEASEAYDVIDSFLRNNLDDADYALYLAALETVFLHPAPRPEFVRLSEEEITQAWSRSKGDVLTRLKPFARAIEDALEEKNRG